MSPGPPPERERPPRLNPFAFPSDTTFRFILLVVAVLGSTMYVWQWIWVVVRSDTAGFAEKALRCQSLGPPFGSDLDAYAGGNDAQGECLQQAIRPQAWWMLGGLALVLVLAVALLLARPWWIARRRRLRPLTAEDAPTVVAEVAELAGEAGLAKPPELVWDPLAPSSTGLAYGHRGGYTVALTGGLVVRQATEPEAFRAVVRHELAHIRNRDVDLAYFTVSLWHAYLAAAALPFALTLVTQSIDTVIGVTWRFLALAALVYLTRNAVLRSREIYADVRASVGERAFAAILRVLDSLPRSAAPVWRRLLRVHPDPDERAATVADTRPLFRLELLAAFGAGVAATIAYESVVEVLGAFVDEGLDVRFLAALTFAPAVIGVVGLGVWRAGFAALAEGRPPPPVWLLSLALAAGFLVGPELALQRGIVGREDPLLSNALEGQGLWWLAGLLLILTLLLAWVRACSSAWIRALAARRSRAAAIVGVLAAGTVLTIVMGVFYISRDVREIISITRAATSLQHEAISQVTWAMPEPVYQLVMNPQILWTLLQPELFAVLVIVIAFPAASGLARHRRSIRDDGWAYLDPGGRLAIPPATFSPLRPLAVGLAGGVAFLLAEVALRAGLHTGVAPETRAQDAFLLAFFAWQVALAVLVQAGTAVVATAASKHGARLLDGLAAAFLAGSVAAFGILGGPTAGGCVDPLSINPGPCAWTIPADFTWDVYRQVVEQGALAALAAGLATSGLLALLRRARSSDAELRPARAAG